MSAQTGSRPVGATGSVNAALVVVVVAVVLLGPPGWVAAVVGLIGVSAQTRWHCHEVAALASLVAVGAVAVAASLYGNPLVAHFSGFIEWMWSPSLSLDAIAAACLTALPVGVPVGLALGTYIVGLGQLSAAGADWHPLERRRVAVRDHRNQARARRLLRDVERQRSCSSPPLGAALGGTLNWCEQGFVTLGRRLANGGLVVAGASGSGKTVTLERLVVLLARLGRKVVFVDCKGTDPDLARRIVAAYCEGSGRDDITVHAFPDEPLNGWVGDDRAIANRLVATQDVSEPFYEAAGDGAVRLAVHGRLDGTPPCRSSQDFLSRLNPSFLAAAWKGSAEEYRATALRQQGNVLQGVAMRFGAFFDAINGAFDGTRSYGDSEFPSSPCRLWPQELMPRPPCATC